MRERVLFIELKRDGGKMTPDQEIWIEALQDARQEVYVFTPADWPVLEKVLL